MPICILHGSDCPEMGNEAVEANRILLLSPPPMPYLEFHPLAKIWLKFWLYQAGFQVEEFSTCNDDRALCKLCAAVDRAAAVIADVTLRDPQIFQGVALARAHGKPMGFIAHERATRANAFSRVIRYTSGTNLLVNSKTDEPSLFECEVQMLIESFKKAATPPPQLPPQLIDDVNRFQRVLLKFPGHRVDEEQHYLEGEWLKVLKRCGNVLPDEEWSIALQWYETARYDKGMNLLKVTPQTEHRQQSERLLKTPGFRHTLENAIFELSEHVLNWTIAMGPLRLYEE